MIDPRQYGGYINSTCTISFPYAEVYGHTVDKDPHFVSVASSYIVGRERLSGQDNFLFTGFDEVSNPDVLDVLVFYDQNDCFNETMNPDDLPYTEQHEIYLNYQLSEDQKKLMCEPIIDCQPNGEALSGVFLGNFNYDIARSVQTYTVPVYGLAQGKTVDFDLQSYEGEDLNCANPLAHSGHGTAFGCSNNVTETCDNVITFQNNLGNYSNLNEDWLAFNIRKCVKMMLIKLLRSQWSSRILPI